MALSDEFKRPSHKAPGKKGQARRKPLAPELPGIDIQSESIIDARGCQLRHGGRPIRGK